MARPEHRFSKDLQKELESLGALVWAIETGATNRGLLDLYIAKRGASLWCELKVVTPHQVKDPRSPVQIKKQKQLMSHGIRALNAHDVRDSSGINHGYHLIPEGVIKLQTLHELALAIIAHLEH